MAKSRIYSCPICDKFFVPVKGKANKFCSLNCYRVSQRRGDYKRGTGRKHECSFCNSEILGQSRGLNRDGSRSKNIFCNRDCYEGYRKAEQKKFIKPCDYCGEDFYNRDKRSRFCCADCRLYGMKNDPVKCKNCGAVYCSIKSRCIDGMLSFISAKMRTCSAKCHNDWIRNNPERKRKISEAFTGKKHPAWLGGLSHDVLGRRGFNWKNHREKAIKRDGGKCVACGMDRKAHKEKYGSDIEVNHIEPFRNFINHRDANKLDNLETVCKSCHRGREKKENLQIVMDFYEIRKSNRSKR